MIDRLKAAVKEIQSYGNAGVGSTVLAIRILREHVPEAFE